jgi:hypothetical protein
LITNTPSLYSLGFIKMCFTCEWNPSGFPSTHWNF